MNDPNDHLATNGGGGYVWRPHRLPLLAGCCDCKNCANCLTYATGWRARLLTSLTARSYQNDLFAPTHAG
ncbi:hypothetical protein [Actinomadura rudentiformis]|uniref:Uncharacterized protein n=1 Tax=Actinomadura rudentiformis TaxID=359158 RepID=A0A6H9Z068_9ACTN|nr:hypothetical protein [Actinomadura rudentiformis]KAB2347261.1 hypothetical protein F8566_19760 [Actinomadura rudentiformis]